MKVEHSKSSDDVFRFVKANTHLFTSLINSEFYCSAPSEINDLFDSKGIFQNTGTIEDYKDHFLLCDRNQYPHRTNDDRMRLEKKFLNRGGLTSEEKRLLFINFRKECIEKFSQMHMVCFSKNCENILMWSHYADSHQGVCLQFDKRLLQESTEALFSDIEYKLLTFSDLMDTHRKGKDVAMRLHCAKARNWKYEEECRLIVPVVDGANIKGLTGRFIKYAPEALIGIIFGAKCPKNTIIAIQGIYKGKTHTPNFYQATALEDCYKLTFQYL